MTITISLTTVVSSIAALSIPGVTNNVGLDKIPMDAEMITPILYPRPQDFITDVTPTRESQGGGGTAMMNMGYTLHYMYLHAPIGEGVSTLAIYQGMLVNIMAILKSIYENDDITGAVDLTLAGISNVGPVGDPSGNPYHGVEIALRVLEFIQ